MGRSRSSIVGLMAIVLFFALAMAALRSASTAWVWGTVNATIALIFLAAIRARFARAEAARAWWFGFALCGSTYLLIAGGEFQHQFLPIRLTDPVWSAVFDAFCPIPLSSASSSEANREIVRQYALKSERIFHNFATIALAYLGAFVIARAFGRPSRRGEGSSPTPRENRP